MISSHTAAEVARGVSRLLLQQGFSPILEFTLANGRRLDVAALGADGTLLGVEIKVALADLRGDTKWPECACGALLRRSPAAASARGRNSR